MQTKERVLYLGTGDVFNPNYGGAQRSHFILKSLIQLYDVDLILDDPDVTTVPSEYSKNINIITLSNRKAPILKRIIHRARNILKLNRYEIIRMQDLSKSTQIQKFLRHTKYKYIVVRYIDMVQFYGLTKEHNLIIDIDDLPELKIQTTLNLSKSTVSEEDLYKANKKIELFHEIARKALISFIPVKTQTGYTKNCFYLPNIPLNFDFNIKERNDFKKEKKIIFVGVMSADMNYLGVDKFLSEIWPSFLKISPEYKFHIIGKGLPQRFHHWKDIQNVIIRGYVEDLKQEYLTSTMVVAPIYNGAGTNLKVLEALAYGCPIVMTDFACRGLDDIIINGESAYIANSNKEFVEYMCNVIDRPEAAVKMGENANLFIKENFSFRSFDNFFLKGINHLKNNILS